MSGRTACCDGFVIRRNRSCGFPNPQSPQGLFKDRMLQSRQRIGIVFSDCKSLCSIAWDYKSPAAIQSPAAYRRLAPLQGGAVFVAATAATDLQSGATGAADFRIRKVRKDFSKTAWCVWTAHWNCFFGLQILILSCVGLQIPRSNPTLRECSFTAANGKKRPGIMPGRLGFPFPCRP